MPKIFQKGYSNILVILILVIGLLAGIYLVKKPTNILPKASVVVDIGKGKSDVRIVSNGQFGIVIELQKFIYSDGRQKDRVPSINELRTLKPGWVRFLYRPGDKLPIFPDDIKTLIVFNGDSVPGVIWEGDDSVWRSYTDKYILELENFIKENGDQVDAIEVWNEEDICEDIFCAKVPEVIYVDMLKRASSIVKQHNPNIKVIMGGLVTNDIYDSDGGYLGRVLKADPNIFDQVDALGLHPYGKTLNNWCSVRDDTCAEELPYGDLAESVKKYKSVLPPHISLWITEIGIGSNNREWQKQYMEMAFDYLKGEAEVIIWYAWHDTIIGGNYGESNFGLYNEDNTIKPAGELFAKYSSK